MKKKCILLRGLPGTGKSTLGKQLVGDNLCEADEYFTDSKGNYKFVLEEIINAHEYCFNKFKQLILSGAKQVGVANVFSQIEYMQPYIDFAKSQGYVVEVIRCTKEYGSIHNVPKEEIELKRAKFMDYPNEKIVR